MNSRTVGLAVLAALVVLDIVLVALALRPGPAVSATPAALPTPVSTAPTADPSAAASPTASSAPTAEPVPAALLQRTAEGSLLLATPGQCGQQAAEGFRTTSGSAEWQPWELPGQIVQRLGVTGQSVTFAVASALDCNSALFYPAENSATSWGSGLPPDFTYYLVPASPARVATVFEGEITSPCGETTIALAATDSSPALLCGDGRVLVSLDDGVNWQERGSVSQGRALAFGAPTLLYAASTAVGCNGLTVSSAGSDEGAQWNSVGCIEGASSAGPVALAATGNSISVVDADRRIYTSDDGGRSFRAGV